MPKVSFSSIGRPLRIALGVFLLAVFAYTLLPGTITGGAQSGRINADLITLRAPIDGRVSFGQARVGERVTAGQSLATLTSPPDRDVRLADLEAQLKALNERLAGIDAQQQALAPILSRLETENRGFQTAVIASLDAQVAQAVARVRRSEAAIALAEAQLKRIQPLAASSFASTAELDQRQANAAMSRADLVAEQKALERLRKEREAAQQGIYLNDSYNNAPYSQQRRDDVELQRLTLATRRADAEAEIAQVQRQVDSERRRRMQVDGAVMQAPMAGILWRQLESEDATIGTSTPLLQIVDCRRLFFEVIVERRGEETPAIGTPVNISFTDNRQQYTRQAYLAAIRGEQDSDRGDIAISGMLQANQLRLIYALAAPPEGSNSQACPVGQTGYLSSAGPGIGAGISTGIGRGLAMLQAGIDSVMARFKQ
ncbi:HlyD family efflux transporter periplasmic adaptor subunit [Ferrovibrio sp.]|uniref:HlyD family secretion protein n=1 Tax=Ferrovibrio sp. TaxID=1917215 RepID=UPI0025BBD88F|nr:HlyD family efflux transporter periplasmic adaptor subunit [Ferrovibrio sp.]MBX3453423.1 HlyD family efflux transporter periplasmic adaptor subunit [Ferrovibrio sp.]